MWTLSAEKRLEEIGNITKEQVDELSNEISVGVGIITEVLLEAKKMGLLKEN